MGWRKLMMARLKYIHEYRDQHGTLKRYFRRPGAAKIRLPGEPGSTEFLIAYNAALAGYKVAPKPLPGESRLSPGSVASAVAEYYQDSAFLGLAAGTRKMRRAILERFREQHGTKRIGMMRPEDVAKMLGKMRPFAARNWLKTLRGLMAFAAATGLRSDDPTERYKPVKAKAGTIHTWTEDEIEIFERHHAVGTRARLAMALMLYTAARRGDAVLLGPQHIREGRIHYRQQKTRRALAIPIHSVLAEIIGSTPTQHLTFLVTAHNKPFTAAGFGNWFREVCREAGLSHCSAHGLRKAQARRLAEAGCSAHEIASITGHLTLAEVQRYADAADQSRMADAAIRTVSRTRIGSLKK
jgi:integrase